MKALATMFKALMALVAFATVLATALTLAPLAETPSWQVSTVVVLVALIPAAVGLLAFMLCGLGWAMCDIAQNMRIAVRELGGKPAHQQPADQWNTLGDVPSKGEPSPEAAVERMKRERAARRGEGASA